MFECDSLPEVNKHVIFFFTNRVICEGKSKRGEALACLQTKLQVVFSDDENGHGFDEKEESKGNAEWTLAAFLQLEVVGR